jgi:hypothetical protein
VVLAFAWSAALGWTLSIEGVLLSVVLAIEAVREYRLFAEKFKTANNPPGPAT